MAVRSPGDHDRAEGCRAGDAAIERTAQRYITAICASRHATELIATTRLFSYWLPEVASTMVARGTATERFAAESRGRHVLCHVSEASMSNDDRVRAEACVALGATGTRLQPYQNRELSLGSLPVSRALPVGERRLVGPWCFLDRFGPLSFQDGRPMDVAPHPHIGLQTITWLLDGEVVHDDSLGCESVLRPGGVHVMTAGSGIAHAEQTPRANSGRLSGVQLWVALPDAHRDIAASFAPVDRVPVIERPGGRIELFAGTLDGMTAPGPHYSPLVGADLHLRAGETLEVPVQPAFEHAVLVMAGDCVLDRHRLESRMLYYLGTERSTLCVSSRGGARVLLIGGPPFPERILMWWNFVARTPDEIAEARSDWEGRRRFGDVPAYAGPRLRAPALTRFARPNAAS